MVRGDKIHLGPSTKGDFCLFLELQQRFLGANFLQIVWDHFCCGERVRSVFVTASHHVCRCLYVSLYVQSTVDAFMTSVTERHIFDL